MGTHITELKDLVVAYVRQEIFSPLKGAGRYVKRGLLGGLVAIVAGIILAVGLLRVLQTADILDIDRGAWSWLVYLAAGFACLAVGGVSAVLALRSRKSS